MRQRGDPSLRTLSEDPQMQGLSGGDPNQQHLVQGAGVLQRHADRMLSILAEGF